MQHLTHRFIRRSAKPVTIMFTDIVDSTRYWDMAGDLQGRLMVNQHNRLAFPVIRKYKGKIVKTIGDAVMASFDSPENALKAAIGIQQALAEYRAKNENFHLEIRIGIHTGKALVEKKDVFGDTVNIAARVEAETDANEILISEATKDQVDAVHYTLTRKTSFIPKGKKEEIEVYRCDWERLPSRIEGTNFDAILPLLAQQREEILIQIAAVVLIRSMKYLTVVPILPFRILKICFGYAVAFAIVLASLTMLPAEYTGNSRETYHESKHLFVRVLLDNANVRLEPSLKSKVVAQADDGDLFLLADVKSTKKVVWNKILIGYEEYGWIARAIPPAFGVAEERLTITNKHYTNTSTSMPCWPDSSVPFGDCSASRSSRCSTVVLERGRLKGQSTYV